MKAEELLRVPNDARRNLQFETRAHIRLQETFDAEHAAGGLADPVNVDFIQRS